MNAAPTGRLDFTCNICSAPNAAPLATLLRESSSCATCRSSVRNRAMVHALTLHAFGNSLRISEVPVAKHIRGIGLSDWAGYADPIARQLAYTNTYFTRRPRFDITKPPAHLLGTLDFITSSDVFEHVAPPVGLAFSCAHALLKPGGALIFSVPYALEGRTVEHYPDLFDFKIIKRSGKEVLVNATRGGQRQEFTELCFHGGGGATLEMRVFSLSGVRDACAEAGFASLDVVGDHPRFGIHWTDPWSQVMIARKPAGTHVETQRNHANKELQ